MPDNHTIQSTFNLRDTYLAILEGTNSILKNFSYVAPNHGMSPHITKRSFQPLRYKLEAPLLRMRAWGMGDGTWGKK